MRFASVTLALSLSLLGCSSDDPPAGPTGPNACVAAGFTCLDNFPMKCIGQWEDVTNPAAKTACGKSVSDGTTDVPCCQKVADPPDTGAPDTGAPDVMTDAESDAADAPSSDATSDAPSDAPSDGG